MCKRNFFRRYALGAPVVGTTNVIFSMRSTKRRLLAQDLFFLTVPVATDSTLPPKVQLCDGTVLDIVYSSSADPADASVLIGQRVYLCTIICVAGDLTLNILNATAPAAAGA
ncbi:MAG: hypothetical protein IJW05_15075 [Lentisphaeria bacterium]|nr:hypothetical protein [Lentisphaeria bacterium]MBQ7404751.1 hypothetical protein [Lentisphaeria bacterium]